MVLILARYSLMPGLLRRRQELDFISRGLLYGGVGMDYCGMRGDY